MTLKSFKYTLLLVVAMVLAACSQQQAVPPASELEKSETLGANVVISQVYGGGGNSGATYKNDFIELFNRGSGAVNITGWTVQYASATGSSWQTTTLSGSLEPGQYYLVQQAAGSGGSEDLPTPDVVGGISMSATSGKIALVSSTAALTGTSPVNDATVVDFVGYGSANGYEGSGPAPTLSNSTAAFRKGGGCIDTDDNAADFVTGAPGPRNSSSDRASCDAIIEPVEIVAWDFESDTRAPSTGSGTASAGTGLGGESFPAGYPSFTGTAWSFNNWSQSQAAEDDRYVQFTTSTAGFTGISFAFDERRSGTGPRTFEIAYSTDGVTFTTRSSTVTGLPNDTDWRSHSFDLSGIEELDNRVYVAFRIYGYGASGAGGTWRFDNVTVSASGTTDEPPVGEEPEEPDTCEADYTPIADIWTGTATGNVTIQGVVTADFRDGLRGFFVQDIAGEGFPVISDGIFAFTPSGEGATYDLEPGNLIRFDARTSSFQGAQQVGFVENIILCDENVSVTPVELTLPLEPEDRWPYVGMLVTLPQALSVTENFLLGRFGMLSVAEGGRLYHPNNGNVAGTPEEVRAGNIRRSLIIDDGSNVQNPNIVPFLEVGETIRIGDTMKSGVSGVMSYGRPSTFEASGPESFRLHVLDTDEPEFENTNPRSTSPEDVLGDNGNIKVSSYNVLNYFVTFDDGSNLSRGARTEAEFRRQRAKLVAAIEEIDADVLGLIEMENEDVVQASVPKEQRRSAVQDLVDGLNEAYGFEAYAAMPDPDFVGSDAIKQAIIYKPGRVTFLAAASDTDPVHNRPPVAGTFRHNEAPFGAFSVVVVHHKSKRCSEGFDDRPGDTEQQFEGCFNELRTKQSQAVRAFIAGLKALRYDSDVVLMGDLNAYALETPITTLTTSGFEDLTRRMDDPKRYSYVFDGESGTLDYAFASATLAAQVTGVDIWHINSGEPRVLEYDQVRFGPYDPYHDDSPYRSSDHDPVILGAKLVTDDLIAALIGDVKVYRDTGVLTAGRARGLLAKLENAQAALARGTPGSRRAAGYMLRAFTNEVRSLVQDGVLPKAQGALMIAMAEAAVAELR